MIVQSPRHALKSLAAYAFAPKSKLPLLPLNPELGQRSFEFYLAEERAESKRKGQMRVKTRGAALRRHSGEGEDWESQ